MAAYRLEAFQREHVDGFVPHGTYHADANEQMKSFDWVGQAERGLAWTGFRDDLVIGFGGLASPWPGRAIGWVHISQHLRPCDMIWVTRQVTFTLNHLSDHYRRVEAPILETFALGHRWAAMLGFTDEGLMRCYDPSGQDYRLYARIMNNATISNSNRSNDCGPGSNGDRGDIGAHAGDRGLQGGQVPAASCPA